MDKTVLVFGSVTAKQYQEVRLHFLRIGHTAKIIRPTDDDFNFGFETIVAQYLRDEPLDRFAPDFEKIYNEVFDDEELACQLTLKYLKARYGTIVGIVVPDDMYDFVMGYGTHTWVATQFAKDVLGAIPLWRVHDDDYIELMKY